MSNQRITIDNPIFAGRIKRYAAPRDFEDQNNIHKQVRQRSKVMLDVYARPHAPNRQSRSQSNASAYAAQHHAQTMRQESVAHPENQQQHAQEKIKPNKPILRRLKNNIFMVAAVSLLVFGGWVSYSGLKTNKHVQAQASKLSQTNASSDDAPPDEKKPNAMVINSYSVSPSNPRLLKIPSLDVSARIKRVGVNAKGQLQAPSNIYDAGWYENSAKPGDVGGAILLDGHVHGPTQPGIFMNLKKLKIGDAITVLRGDNQSFSYKVVGSKTYDVDAVDMKNALVSADPGKLGLNLITCTGSVERGTSEYTQRLVVFAVANE